MKTEGNILIYGAEGASEMLECLMIGSGYGVKRLDDREELRIAMADTDSVALLYDFHTRSGNETDSLAFLNDLRSESDKPILAILSGNKEMEMLRILALNAGADDVLEKECSGMEALAKIQAHIRCYKRLVSNRKASNLIKLDELEVDDSTKSVTVRGEKVDLTPTEYKILRLLLEEPGRVLSNKQIYERIWKMAPIGTDNTIAVHIRHIREKIEANPQEPKFVQVVWGQGYKVG